MLHLFAFFPDSLYFCCFPAAAQHGEKQKFLAQRVWQSTFQVFETTTTYLEAAVVSMRSLAGIRAKMLLQ